MPTFEFTSPEGKKYEITGPDGSTQEQAFAKLQEQLSASPPTSTPAVAATQAPAPASPVAGQPQRSGLEQVGRSVGLTGRMLAQDAGGTVGMVGDALNAGVNMLLPKSMALKSPSKMIQAGIDKVLPVPETTGERVGDFIGTVVAGGIRGGVDPLARAVTKRFAAPTANALGNERLQTLAEAKPLGFVATPSTTRAGPLAKTTEFVAGKSHLVAEASAKNEEAYNAMARRVIRAPADARLTPELLNDTIETTYKQSYEPLTSLRTRMVNNKSYTKELDNAITEFQGASRDFPAAAKAEVRTLIDSYREPSFSAKGAVDAMRNLQEDATAAFRNNKPQVGHANLAIKKALENSIERNLSKSTNPEHRALLDTYKEGKKQLAIQYTIRDALKEGTGSIDPAKLRSALKNKHLTGDLKIAAKFANTFPQVSGIEKAAGGSTWADRIPYGPTGAAILGTTMFGPVGGSIAAAATPITRGAIRKGMLTGPGQTLMNPKNLTPLEQFLRRRNIVNAMPTTMQQVSGLFED